MVLADDTREPVELKRAELEQVKTDLDTILEQDEDPDLSDWRSQVERELTSRDRTKAPTTKKPPAISEKKAGERAGLAREPCTQ